MTEVRLITFRSLILERFDSSSSWMPSAKKALSFSSLRFSSGSTAMLFSGIAATCAWGGLATIATGLVCRFSIPKYHPASAKNIRAATPAPSTTLLLELLAGTVVIALVCAGASCSRCPTSAADCGRRGGSLARHAATASSQTCGTNADSMSNSFRRSVIEGATLS